MNRGFNIIHNQSFEESLFYPTVIYYKSDFVIFLNYKNEQNTDSTRMNIQYSQNKTYKQYLQCSMVNIFIEL